MKLHLRFGNTNSIGSAIAGGGEPALTGQVANHECEAVDASSDLRLPHRRTTHPEVEPAGLVEHHLRPDRESSLAGLRAPAWPVLSSMTPMVPYLTLRPAPSRPSDENALSSQSQLRHTQSQPSSH